MKNQLRGCVRINAQGKNLYRFINMIHNRRMNCFDQYVKKDVFYCEIYRSDLERIYEFAEECEVELRHFEYATLSQRLRKYRRRFGILVGVIAGAIACVYFSSVVVTIDVIGNSRVSTDTILSALEELDVTYGSRISDINFTYCENELRLMVDGVSWAGIRRTGNRIVVEITEIVEKPEMTIERVPCNVVSQREAQIISTSVYDGQLMRIVGDYVMPGDLLISGVIEDSKGHVTKHHAMGAITGIYEETISFTEEFASAVKKPVGNTRTERYLKLFSAEIPLFIGRNEYESYLAEEREQYFSIGEKELPLGIVTRNITETEYTESVFSKEELDLKLQEKIFLYEKNFLSDVKILDREIIKEQKENSLTYTVKYTVEGEIGIQKEIFIK